MPNTYEPIASTTLSSATSNITFNSIPATYTDLRIIWVYKAVLAGNYPTVRLNADSGTNYSYVTLYATGVAGGNGSQRSTNNTEAYLISNAEAPTSEWQLQTVDIFSYAGSKFKTLLNTYSGNQNGSGSISRGVNLWRSTSAITSVALKFDAGGNMPSGTTATLYGILKA